MTNALTISEPILILSDRHGVYIPQLFCEDIDEAWCKESGVNYEDVLICQEGPDHEWYWEAWQTVLDNANRTDKHGTKWMLYQDGDLWEYPEGYEFPDF